VIKVEAPGGDSYRYTGRPSQSAGMSPGYIALGRNKKSVVLDLKDAEARERLAQLIAECDVFIHNIRAEAIERLGFGYEAVRALAPQAIYVHCVGFGSNGPYAGLQAYDDVIQAASGAASLLPRVDGDPRPRYIPSLIADKVGGLHAAYATMAAVIHRLRTGEGQFVEVPMFEAFAGFMLKEHLAGLTFDPPVGHACYARQIDPDRQPFPTRDGHVSIVPYRLAHFVEVVRLLGDEAFASDPRFATPQGIAQAIPDIYRRIAELTAGKTTDEVIAIMRAANTPAMPVRDMADVPADPHLLASGMIQRSEHPSEGTLLQLREPSRFSAWEQPEPTPAPLLGEHQHEL
jgi:crotonobetainyl-CoA:carnitine CoA-transferase CaiB-like acyl-CoA transferase